MRKGKKTATLLIYFAKQRRKESTETNEQETCFSDQPAALLLLSRLSFSPKKRTNLGRPNSRVHFAEKSSIVEKNWLQAKILSRSMLYAE